MWSSIANLKENLNKIALDVHDDDDEELSMYNSRDRDVNSVPDRRISRNFSHSRSPTPSPFANGFDCPYSFEIEQYKAEIKRLQDSEAEIKALSVNYAALLKEREDQISRLNEENGTLKQNLHIANSVLTPSKSILKVSNVQSPNRQSKAMVKSRAVSPLPNGSTPKQDGQSNGTRENEKELMDLLEEKNKDLAAIQATHDTEVKQLKTELDKERGNLSRMKLRLEEEQRSNGSFQQEMKTLKVENDKLSPEMTKVRDELHQKILEIRRLQIEFHRRGNDETDAMVENLKKTITDLEKENTNLKVKKDELEAALRATRDSSAYRNLSGGINEKILLSDGFRGKEEMDLSLQKLEKDLKEACQQRDKALQQLNRLKQHLLDKESEEAEKMDEDSKVIEELRAKNDYQMVQITQLEKALKQSVTSQQELKLLNENDLKKSKEIIDDLNRKMASYMSMIETKNVEVLNLQAALGQYYAEIEAKERLAEDLAASREESARLLELLKEGYEQAETSKREKEELLSKLSKVERMLAEGKNRVTKLEDDNEKLRRALEHSMTRLNRMSVDSDFLVDRRIVIKLLVTYFLRNHSKEVLDLMVRMLGFSDEDKQRIGIAQQGAGKGVVRGVLGLPGRLVGGILGSGSSEASSNMASDNQSFADLWVDFLLKETEEREKRESALNGSNGDQSKGSPIAARSSPLPDHTGNAAATLHFARSTGLVHQNEGMLPSRGSILPYEKHDSEFSTVPLSSSDTRSQFSKMLPRYS